jgi:DNA-directed RNA polymerase subunit RPC12/RpoP
MEQFAAMDGEATVRCTECGSEWYGRAAAEAMSAIGHCIRCKAAVEFPEGAGLAELEPDTAWLRGLGPHQVLGTPRI